MRYSVFISHSHSPCFTVVCLLLSLNSRARQARTLPFQAIPTSSLDFISTTTTTTATACHHHDYTSRVSLSRSSQNPVLHPAPLVRAFSGTTPHCFSFFVLCGPFADACATRLIPRYTSPLRALYYCPLFSLFLFSPPANAILFFRLTSVSSTSALGFSFHCYFASPWLPTTPSTIRRLKSAVLRPILMPILTRNTPRAIMASPPNPSSRVSSTSWSSPRRVCLYHPKRTSPICSIPIKPTSISRSTKTPVPTVLPPPSTIRRRCWIPRFINSRDRLVSLSIRPI